MNGATISPFPSSWELLRRSLSFYRSHWQTILGIAIIPVLITLPQLFFPKEALPLAFLVTILAALGGFFSRLALLEAIVEEGEPEGGVPGAFRKSIKLLFPFLWVSALSAWATIGASFLLVIPGIMISIWLSLSLYVVFAENNRGLNALAVSWWYIEGYWWRVFFRFFVFSAAVFLVSLLFLFITMLISIGPTISMALRGGTPDLAVTTYSSLFVSLFNNLIVVPLGIIYGYGIYRALRNIKTELPQPIIEPKRKTIILTFIILGIIGVLALITLSGFFLVNWLPQFLSSTNTGTALPNSFSFFTSLSSVFLFHTFLIGP